MVTDDKPLVQGDDIHVGIYDSEYSKRSLSEEKQDPAKGYGQNSYLIREHEDLVRRYNELNDRFDKLSRSFQTERQLRRETQGACQTYQQRIQKMESAKCKTAIDLSSMWVGIICGVCISLFLCLFVSYYSSVRSFFSDYFCGGASHIQTEDKQKVETEK